MGLQHARGRGGAVDVLDQGRVGVAQLVDELAELVAGAMLAGANGDRGDRKHLSQLVGREFFPVGQLQQELHFNGKVP